MENRKPIFYVIARSGVNSMNPGKLAAQVAHAADMKTAEIDFNCNPAIASDVYAALSEAYDKWLMEGNGFGTTIVLENGEIPWEVIRERINELKTIQDDTGILSGIVLDDTYPIRDGSVTHFVPFETCAWFFDSGFSKRHPFEDLPLCA